MATRLFAPISALVGGIGIASAMKLGAQFEQTEIAFRTLLGSAKAAKRMLRDLEDFAVRTPFDIQTILQSTKMMLAMGFAADDVLSTLTAMGDATSALGGGQDVLTRLIRALGQMQAKGAVSAEEMRQLAEAGIPAWQMLADAIGTDLPTAMKKAESKQISAAQGVSAILHGMTERFGGAMEAQSKTVTGAMTNLKDSMTRMMKDVGLTINKEFAVGDKVRAVTKTLSSIGPVVHAAVRGAASILVPMLDRVRNAISAVISSIRAWMQSHLILLKSTLQITAVMVGAFVAVKAVIFGVTVAVWTLKIAIAGLLSPTLLAIAAIAGIATALAYIQGEGITTIERVSTGFTKMANEILRNGIYAFTAVEVAIRNWKDTALVIWKFMQFAVVSMFEDFKHTFTVKIPAIWTWFKQNWKDLFMDLTMAFGIFMKNLWENLKNFVTAAWDYVVSFGEKGSFMWTGLLEGFTWTVAQLPEIAAREMTDLEKQLALEIGQLTDTLGNKINKKYLERMASIRTLMSDLSDAFKLDKVGGEIELKVPELPKMPGMDADKGLQAEIVGLAEMWKRISTAKMDPQVKATEENTEVAEEGVQVAKKQLHETGETNKVLSKMDKTLDAIKTRVGVAAFS